MEQEDTAALVRKAAIVLNTKIRRYKLEDIKNILNCEFHIDNEVTDTKMSALSLACSLDDSDEVNETHGATVR